MIIVSQDRERIINFNNVCNLFIARREEKEKEEDINYTRFFDIQSSEVDTGVEVLGRYKTEERAKKVLQEIILAYKYTQQKYCTIGDLEKLIGEFDNNVYEMPLE